MDWNEFSKELSQEGFFELANNQTNDEAENYEGGCSYESIQKLLEAQKFENDLQKIWAFFGGDRQEAYYSKKMLSYSFLKHVDSIRFEKQSFGNKERNFALGRAFEDMLTNCLNEAKFPDLTTEDFLQLQKMCEYAKQDKNIAYFLKCGMLQVEFETTYKGFKIKGKRDFQAISSAMDIKTTSCVTQKAFEKACIDFGYLVQGVIYSQDVEINEYFICGVSKKKDAVFTVKMQPEHFEQGAQELDRLLENLAYYGIADYFKA
jgi:hypothetical protein